MPYRAARVRHNRKTLSGFNTERVDIQLTTRVGGKQHRKAVTLDTFLKGLEYPSQRVAVIDAVQKHVPVPTKRRLIIKQIRKAIARIKKASASRKAATLRTTPATK